MSFFQTNRWSYWYIHIHTYKFTHMHIICPYKYIYIHAHAHTYYIHTQSCTWRRLFSKRRGAFRGFVKKTLHFFLDLFCPCRLGFVSPCHNMPVLVEQRSVDSTHTGNICARNDNCHSGFLVWCVSYGRGGEGLEPRCHRAPKKMAADIFIFAQWGKNRGLTTRRSLQKSCQ